MKKTVLIFMLVTVSVLASTITQAQTAWTPLDTVNNVNISYFEESNCLDSAAVYLKIENTNNQPVSVTWSLWTGSLPITVALAANETMEGYCSESSLNVIVNIPPGMSASNMNPIINVQ